MYLQLNHCVQYGACICYIHKQRIVSDNRHQVSSFEENTFKLIQSIVSVCADVKPALYIYINIIYSRLQLYIPNYISIYIYRYIHIVTHMPTCIQMYPNIANIYKHVQHTYQNIYDLSKYTEIHPGTDKAPNLRNLHLKITRFQIKHSAHRKHIHIMINVNNCKLWMNTQTVC